MAHRAPRPPRDTLSWSRGHGFLLAAGLLILLATVGLFAVVLVIG